MTERRTLTHEDAEQLTNQIQLRLDTIAENSEAVVELIEEARVGNAHEALGYASWTKYVAEKFGGSLARLDVSRKPSARIFGPYHQPHHPRHTPTLRKTGHAQPGHDHGHRQSPETADGG